MKNTLSYALAAFATSALAAPTQSRRQAADGPVGYASLNGGTTGGAGGTTTTVSSLSEFTAAATADEPTVVYVSGKLTGGDGEPVRVTSDTSIIGLNSESGIEGVGLYIKEVSNVIVQNLAISKVVADAGDAIGIQESTNVWIDHCDLSSDLDHDKDYYDGLLDVTHAADYVTVSNTYIHDHYKASLVGHSDSNGDEDTGHLTVTYANNYWVSIWPISRLLVCLNANVIQSNINSRGPSVRFGKVHIFNNYYENIDTGAVNTRMGAQVLVESTQFVNVNSPITSKDSDETGTAEVNDVDLGGGENDAPVGSGFQVEYEYTLLGSEAVKAAVVGTAGNTLSF